MADITTTTTDPAAVTAAPVAPAAAPAAPAPAPVATAPAASPPEAAKPPYLNPWATRGKATAAKPAAKPAEVRPSTVSASPAVPAADPRVDALMTVLGETVAQDLSGVPANVAATIRAIAGEDPVAQRKALNAMRANGLAMGTTASNITAPASTTMPTAAVAVTASPASTDAARLSEYEKLSKVAPILASQYRQAHGAAIERASKSRPNN